VVLVPRSIPEPQDLDAAVLTERAVLPFGHMPWLSDGYVCVLSRISPDVVDDECGQGWRVVADVSR
jgi:hypothetical protein